MGRKMAGGAGALSLRALFIISLIGGVLGALLLLATPPAFFAMLVPWLVLFATAVFAWGSFFRRPSQDGAHWGAVPAGIAQFLIAIYGGYFGGGIGFLMLAALTMAGVAVRQAGATKNVLAAAMNASAVAIFVFSGDVGWLQAGIVAVAAILGGVAGGLVLKRVNERALRVVVVVIGIALTIGLFVRR